MGPRHWAHRMAYTHATESHAHAHSGSQTKLNTHTHSHAKTHKFLHYINEFTSVESDFTFMSVYGEYACVFLYVRAYV